MAVRDGVLTKGLDGYVSASWEGLLDTSNDTGAPISTGKVDGLCAQLVGTLGTGGEVTMQGSNTGEDNDWGTLQDPGGAPVVLDAIGEMFLIGNRPCYIRPLVSAGDGDTDLDVWLVGTR